MKKQMPLKKIEPDGKWKVKVKEGKKGQKKVSGKLIKSTFKGILLYTRY